MRKVSHHYGCERYGSCSETAKMLPEQAGHNVSVRVYNMEKIGNIHAFYALAKNIAFFRHVLLRYGRTPVKQGRLLKPHFFGAFHYALAEIR